MHDKWMPSCPLHDMIWGEVLINKLHKRIIVWTLSIAMVFAGFVIIPIGMSAQATPPPAGFSVTIEDDESSGIAGQRRTITVTPAGGSSTNRRFLLVQITEAAAGSRPSISAIELQNRTANADDKVIISYQRPGATIDVWLFETLTDLSMVAGTLPPILAHDSTR